MNINIDERIKIEDIKEIVLKKDNGICDKIIFKMPKISLDQISQTYIGKAHSCMCGCSGTYSYLKSSQKYGSKDRGYKVSDDEISERSVKFVLNKLKNNEMEGIQVIENYIFSYDIGTRTYVLYLKQK